MIDGMQFDLTSIGTISVAGVDYDVCSHQGPYGAPQVAWIARGGVVVARVIGFVRGEPAVIDKEAALSWSDEHDAGAAASAAGVWIAAGLSQGTVTAE